MRHDQTVEQEVRNPSTRPKKDVPHQTTPGNDGTGWIFPLLMIIIGLGVLGLILKSLGVF
jgi:hypothetical protein